MKNFLIQWIRTPYVIRLKNFVINFMLQRRNTYLFYSVIEEKLLFYFESRMKLSNEKNIKNILDYHNLWLRKIIENIINSLVTYHNAKKDLLFFLSLSPLSPQLLLLTSSFDIQSCVKDFAVFDTRSLSDLIFFSVLRSGREKMI